jgi:pimeloyl-ACP methyl ester carboxylesterase
VLAGLGHCLHDEQPERFNSRLLAWLHQRRPAQSRQADT